MQLNKSTDTVSNNLDGNHQASFDQVDDLPINSLDTKGLKKPQ
jgi:hypothetical protein